MTAGPAPALRKGLAILRVLAGRVEPVPAATLARELGLARSSVYDLLTELEAADFVVRVPPARWALGVAAFEIGSAYHRAAPLARIGRPVIEQAAAGTGGAAHLGVLHGNELLYLVKAISPRISPHLVTDVGVRLPAQLTATGVAILARLPRSQVVALFPDAAAFVVRTDRGPAGPGALRTVLAETRRRGWAVEDGQISAGTASVAAAVLDHAGRPIAAAGITVRHDCPAPGPDCLTGLQPLAAAAIASARRITTMIGGQVTVP